MRVVVAPENDFGKAKDVKLFLAGGITNCRSWQADVIRGLSERPDLDDLVVFNPRRDNFPMLDPNAAYEQIKWEFDRLQGMDIFSMMFCAGESPQPICMYELGRNLVAMQYRFPKDWADRVVVTCDNAYIRRYDVEVQISLAYQNPLDHYREKSLSNKVFFGADYDNLITRHVDNIVAAYKCLME